MVILIYKRVGNKVKEAYIASFLGNYSKSNESLALAS